MTDHPAAIAERARVVEFLRRAPVFPLGVGGEVAHMVRQLEADRIERGHHIPDASNMVDHITQSGGRGD